MQPILARLAVRGTADLRLAAPGHHRAAAGVLARANACINDPLVAANFCKPGKLYEVYVLAEESRVELDLPLGYSNRGGMRGVQHYSVPSLLRAENLKGLEQAPW